jgi:hypothetical protein
VHAQETRVAVAEHVMLHNMIEPLTLTLPCHDLPCREMGAPRSSTWAQQRQTCSMNAKSMGLNGDEILGFHQWIACQHIRTLLRACG